MHELDTIAAIATPSGPGGIGIIRISGPRAIEIACGLFSRTLDRTLTHHVQYGYILDPPTRQPVDEVLLTVMLAPRTYTRQDVVEINCHGGYVSVSRVLKLVLGAGARLAEPGEFTRRAFLSGRIDLSQAEAALDLITARSEEAARLALHQLRGGLSERVNALRDVLIGACAHIEAQIDFPEEDMEPDRVMDIKQSLAELSTKVADLARSYDEGRLYREGLRVAIVGRPNVGKSSLLNALLARDRAIVNEAPGTTRDVIEEGLVIHGLPVRVMDTAGIRQSHDMVEAEGVRRSLEALGDADLVLGVLDGSRAMTEEDRHVLDRISGKRAIIVINKADLPEALEVGALGRYRVVRVSAKTGAGVQELKQAVHETCVGGGQGREGAEGVMVTNIRHKVALEGAGQRLGAALEALEVKQPLEIVALELREAMEQLGSIVGVISTEDILDRIFSDFCLGK